MDGEYLRKKIKETGVPIAEIARKIGQSRPNLSQALSTKDVKTGLVEKLAEALGLPLSYFYGGTDAGTHAIATGNKAVAAVNSTIGGGADSVPVLQERVRSLENLVQEKERLIKVYERILGDGEARKPQP